ncbi:MAG TPA: amidohydrolase, partial [Acidobacteriota bacterium]|nr:amidohydrolase [Acidobacteriota bacterium]
MKRLFLFSLAVLFLNVTARAQEKPHAFVGAEIIPITGAPISNGVLVVHKGKIVAVGPAKTTQIPADAERHEVSGKVLMPGLVDSHSHIGGPGGGDGEDADQVLLAK